MTTDEIDREVERRVEAELTSINTEELYDQMLDDCYSFKPVGGIFALMEPHRVLAEMDPIAYRCGVNDYEDSLRDEYECVNDLYYDRKEVQDIRDTVKAKAEESCETCDGCGTVEDKHTGQNVPCPTCSGGVEESVK